MKGSRPIVRVGIYLRKSRADDGVQDLDKHKKYLIDICSRNGWAYELYEEIDSSQDLFRAELQRLRKDITLDKIDGVMVHAVDRLSRKSRHFLEIIEDYFIEQGMTKLFIKDTEQDLTDATTITMLQLQATLSQAEYSFIVRRLNEGRKASLKQGIITGKVIYGYTRDSKSKKIIPHLKESKVVRKIADMLLEGEAYGTICDKLNALGHRTRKGNLWDVHNIKSIAHSPIIRGHVIQEWKDEKIEVRDSHPAIITEAEYAKIKEILDNRAENYKSLSKAPKHCLQGLLRCTKCHKVMTISGSKPSRKKLPDGTVERSGDYVYYIRTCRPYLADKEKTHCGNLGCKAETAEEQIRLIIKEYQHMIKQKMELLLKVDAKDIKKGTKDVLSDIKTAIKKLENNKKTWEDTYKELVGGAEMPFDKTFILSRLAKIKEEKSSLLEQLYKAENEYKAVDIEQELKHLSHINEALEQWDTLSNEQKRQTLQITFKEMRYSRFDKDAPPLIEVGTIE